MIRYLARRAAHGLLMLFGVSILMFLLFQTAPGDFLSEIRVNSQISAETIAQLRIQYGLDQPLPLRYWQWLKSSARGDFGYSFAYNTPASTLLLPRARNTLLLSIPALLISWLIAVPLGVLAAGWKSRWADRLFSGGTSALLALPDVLIALLALLIALKTGIFPVGGMTSINPQHQGTWARLRDLGWHMVLPVAAMVIGSLTMILRHVRAAVSEVLESSYMRAAEGHGLPRLKLLFGYALPAAANPLISLFGLSVALLLSVSLLIEVVMSWPGIGPLLLEAILARDLFVVIGAVMLSTVFLMAAICWVTCCSMPLIRGSGGRDEKVFCAIPSAAREPYCQKAPWGSAMNHQDSGRHSGSSHGPGSRTKFRLTWAIWFLLMIHAVVVLAGFIAPYSFETQEREHPYAPPTRLHFMDCSGKFHFRPFVYVTRAAENTLDEYQQDCSQPVAIKFFPQGDRYTILGMFSSTRHLFGVTAPANLFLMGTDGFGRDQFSRLLYGGQVSLFAGFVAAAFSAFTGLLLGGIAGMYAGRLDDVAMRFAEIFITIPWFYLLIAVRAFLPLQISPVTAFVLVVSVIGIVGWSRPARLVRGVILSARERNFVLAARGFGASNAYLLRRHLMPLTFRVLLTQMAVLIPQFILAEVILSFLGLGIGEPFPSWGNMLAQAQQYHVLVSYWWMLLPGLAPVPVFLAYHSLAETLQERIKSNI